MDDEKLWEKKLIYKSSKAAGPLFEWVEALKKHKSILVKIKPL